jgi:hypothetical protein
MISLNNKVFEISKELMKQKEKVIMEQLNDLVSKKLLVIQETEPVLIQCPMSYNIKLEQKVRLVVQDSEYIEKLEKENKNLKDKLEKIESAFKENQDA